MRAARATRYRPTLLPRERPRRDAELSDAAARVFHAHGYSNASVRHVAEELGILKGSVYHYVTSKEELLFRLYEEVHAAVDRIIEDLSSSDGLDPLECIGAYVRRHVLYNLGDLDRVAVYYRELEQLDRPHRAAVLSWRARHERFVTGLIEEARDAGLAEAGVDALGLTRCLFATIAWPSHWYRPEADGYAAAVADACVAFALHGLTTRTWFE